MQYHTDRICEQCIETANRLHQVRTDHGKIRNRRWRAARNFDISREERWANLDKYDNTLHDLNATTRMIRRDHAEHMAG